MTEISTELAAIPTNAVVVNRPKSWRAVIPVHPAADLFPMMTPDELKALGEDIRKNGMAVPIMVCKASGGGLCLIDGRNRLDALEAVGVCVADAFLNEHGELRWQDTMLGGLVRLNRVYPKDLDPYEYVLSANIHRRHLTADQKRDLIANVLKAQPGKSDRQIAEQTKASPSTVGKVRKEMEQTGDVSKLDTRIDTKGRKQPTHKPKKKRRTEDDYLADKKARTTAERKAAEHTMALATAAAARRQENLTNFAKETILRAASWPRKIVEWEPDAISFGLIAMVEQAAAALQQLADDLKARKG